jgi:hypothetical protein
VARRRLPHRREDGADEHERPAADRLGPAAAHPAEDADQGGPESQVLEDGPEVHAFRAAGRGGLPSFPS